MAARIAVIEVDAFQMLASVQINGAVVVDVLGRDDREFRRLKNLDRERQVGEARYPWHEAFRDWIGSSAVLKILFLFLERGGQVRDFAIRRIDDHSRSGRNSGGSRVRLQIV